MLDIKRNKIKIGLEKPIRILHITDSHLSYYCGDDTQFIINQAKKRDQETSDRNLRSLTEYGEKNCDLIVHSGDLIDFVSKPCVDFAREFLKNNKILFVAGNHEYWRCDGSREDMAHRLKSLEIMGGELCEGMFYNSHIIGGVNFVGIDDSFHQTEYEQLDFLKKEVEKGYPVILFMHAPLYEKELYEKSYEFWKGEICLLGSDARIHPEVVGDIAEPTEASKAFYEYVINEPLIKAVLTGHLHFSYESRLAGGKIQYVTDRGDRGNARMITIE